MKCQYLSVDVDYKIGLGFCKQIAFALFERIVARRLFVECKKQMDECVVRLFLGKSPLLFNKIHGRSC